MSLYTQNNRLIRSRKADQE